MRKLIKIKIFDIVKFCIKACETTFLKAIRILLYRAAFGAFRKIRLSTHFIT